MKKYIFIFAAFISLGLTTTSCEDLLEADSKGQIYDPDLNDKTDSIFYTLGMMKSLQQCIDQHVLLNELRGDLVTTNSHSSVDMKNLAQFNYEEGNAYDSAYLYYRIINNCNYFIAHRDTTLKTGARNVAIGEYVQAKAMRAWTYIQLAKIYGEVPFFTTPITSISEANQKFPKKNLQQICAELIPDLAPYSGTGVPYYGDIDAGESNNNSGSKTIQSSQLMFPVDVVLGDLYLESNQYAQAAKSYFKYLYNGSQPASQYYLEPMLYITDARLFNREMTNTIRDVGSSWSNIFDMSKPSDVITYVPMAVNSSKGIISNLPAIFGYDFYSTTAGSQLSPKRFLVERQLQPSAPYQALVNAQNFYYRVGSDNTAIASASIGDMRAKYTWYGVEDVNDSAFSICRKYVGANINIYRTTTVYLRLAEAINRMGYPDAAFAILKDGYSSELKSKVNAPYLRDTSRTLLTTTLPFLSTENVSKFEYSYGIHGHGSGFTIGTYTPYQYTTVLAKKLKQLADAGSITIPDTINLDSLSLTDNADFIYGAQAIDAVEDLICDECALELACEGTRFADLTRFAAHKNEAATYGSTYGYSWLAKKLAFKKSGLAADDSWWYLPFK